SHRGDARGHGSRGYWSWAAWRECWCLLCGLGPRLRFGCPTSPFSLLPSPFSLLPSPLPLHVVLFAGLDGHAEPVFGERDGAAPLLVVGAVGVVGVVEIDVECAVGEFLDVEVAAGAVGLAARV